MKPARRSRVRALGHVLLFAGALAAGATPAEAQRGRQNPEYLAQGARVEPFPLPEEPQRLEGWTRRIRVTPVVRGVPRPFSLLILPGGDMLLSERRTGLLRRVHDGELVAEPMGGVPEVHTGFHSGLLDLAAHPDFESNRWIYFTYHKPLEGEDYAIALGRGRYESTRLADVEELYVGTPTRRSGGSRLAFAPDGTIYITTGGATGGDDAQDLTGTYGKILRLNDDGTVPEDNPFAGREDVRPEIFSYGHRDHYGLTFHPDDGRVFQVELGPLGGDELNVIEPGGNYGWPLYGYGRRNNGAPMDHPYREGIAPALITWQPGIAPSGLMIYTGDAFPEWKGNVFVGSLQRGRIRGTGGLERVQFDEKLWEQRRETLLTELHQRVRDVRQGPDGLIYVITDEEDGAILRIEPAPPTE